MTSTFSRAFSRHGMKVEDIDTLHNNLRPSLKFFEAGAQLVSQGAIQPLSYLVVEGWAVRYKRLSDGRRQIVGILLPGDLSNLSPYIMPPADHSVASLSAITVYELTSHALRSCFESGRRTSQAFWTKTYEAICLQREWMVSLGRRSASERVGHILCEMIHRLQSLGMNYGNQYPFLLNQSDLSDALGLSLVHVNKRLSDMRSKGLVLLKNRVLTIYDLESLEKESLFDPAYLQTLQETEQALKL